MSQVNIVALSGRITNNPELKTSTSGTKLTNVAIAVNGNKEGDVSFIDLVLFNSNAEILVKYCRKGDLISVTGRLKQRKYETTDGSFRSITEVIVDNLQLPPKTGERSNEPMTQAQALNSGKDFVPSYIDEDLGKKLSEIPF